MISLVSARQCLKIVWNPIFGVWDWSVFIFSGGTEREKTTLMMMLHHRHCSVSTMNAIKLFSLRSVKHFTSLDCVSMCACFFFGIFGMFQSTFSHLCDALVWVYTIKTRKKKGEWANMRERENWKFNEKNISSSLLSESTELH